jgi:hypothetical protein
MDEKFLNKHQRLARGMKPFPIETQSQDFGSPVTAGSKSYLSVGNTEKRKEVSYGAGDTTRGPPRD